MVVLYERHNHICKRIDATKRDEKEHTKRKAQAYCSRQHPYVIDPKPFIVVLL